eukprot:5421883-Prymnesium_polylepis.1
MSGTPWSVNSAPPGSPPDFNATSCGAGTKESPPTWTYILGVLLGITASIGINVGNNVQALGLAKQAKSGDTKHNRLFWMGTWTFVIASIVNFGAFGLAPVRGVGCCGAVPRATRRWRRRAAHARSNAPPPPRAASQCAGVPPRTLRPSAPARMPRCDRS